MEKELIYCIRRKDKRTFKKHVSDKIDKILILLFFSHV
jgi:hypothetical protein